MFGKFELYKSKAGKWRWRLKARNGQIIAMASQGYSSKQAAQNGLESVRWNAPFSKTIEIDDQDD